MRVEEFEDLGFFWLPSDKKAARRVPGVLRASAHGAITLETFGLADGEPDSLASDLTLRDGQATSEILGVTRERGFVTLEQCLRTGSSYQAQARGAIFNSATYLARWLFVGVTNDKQSGVRLSRVKFDVEGLDEWLALSGIRVDASAMQGQVTIAFQKPPTIAHEEILVGENGRIGFGYTIPSAWKETTEARVSQHAYVELATECMWTADEAAQRMMWFRDFLRLATDQSVAVTGLTGYSRDVTEPAQGGGERQSEIEIIFEERDQGQADRNLLGPLMLFQRSDLDDELQICFARWFETYSKHHEPFRLFFSAVDSSNDSTLTEKFRHLSEALETLDKALHDTSESSLSERIIRLAEPFSGSLGNRRAIKDFGTMVADTRNEMVHHNVRKGREAAKGAELLRLTYQCELLLIYHFTAVVTGSPSSALEMIKGKEAVAKRLRLIEGG